MPNEKDWPYDIEKFKQKPPSSLKVQAGENKIQANFYSEELQIGDLKAIKCALSESCPVLMSLGLDCYFRFNETAKGGYFKIPKKQNIKDLEGHTIILLGYNNEDRTNGYGGHFIAANFMG